jgi:hypothetical protein
VSVDGPAPDRFVRLVLAEGSDVVGRAEPMTDDEAGALAAELGQRLGDPVGSVTVVTATGALVTVASARIIRATVVPSRKMGGP